MVRYLTLQSIAFRFRAASIMWNFMALTMSVPNEWSLERIATLKLSLGIRVICDLKPGARQLDSLPITKPTQCGSTML